MELSRHGVAALLCCALAAPASMPAHAQNAAALRIADAWSRPTPPGSGVGAVYLTIENSGAVPDRLLAVSSPLATRVEFHQSTRAAGIMSMRAVSFIECPAGASVRVAPGGLHIMLLGLKQPLLPGSSFPVTLQFRDAGSLSVNVSVQSRD